MVRIIGWESLMNDRFLCAFFFSGYQGYLRFELGQ